MMRLALSIVAALTLAQSALAGPPAGTAQFAYFDYAGSDPLDAAAPLMPGHYRNPVIPGFHPDPSVVRVGKEFYLVNSSFAFFPGLPVFRSRDLVNWTQIGNAFDRPGMLDLTDLGINRGLFAPTLRFHAGRFYIISTCIDCGMNFIISARNPAGPWTDPVFLPPIDGIDPDLFFDDDGAGWIANNGPPVGPPRYDGHRAIWLQQFDLKTMKMIGPRRVIVDGGVHPDQRPIWTEGPHIVKRDGWYHLFTAEGGTASDHSETIYRARRVWGPYTPGPINPILTQRDLPSDRPLPVAATGHADPVQDHAGNWWAVFLGTRPYTANLSNLGRETFLLPVAWPRGAWPLILPARTALPQQVRGPALRQSRNHWRDDFAATRLAPEWLMLRTPKFQWYDFSATPSELTLTPGADTLSGSGNPAFFGLRQQHQNAVVETEVRFASPTPGTRAGLALFADERHHYFFGLAGGNGGQIIVARRNGADDPADGQIVAAAAFTARDPVKLRISITGGTVSFAYAGIGGSWVTLLDQADASILASEPTNQFTGTIIGPYAAREQ